MTKRRLVCEIGRFESGKRRDWDDPGRLCSLGMTLIEFRGKICRLGKGSDIFDMGTMGKDNKNSVNQGYRDIDLPPGVEMALF